MTTRNYSIDSADGNELCAGLSEHTAREVAQRHADRLGETVYLYPTPVRVDDDGETIDETEAIEPTMGARVEKIRERSERAWEGAVDGAQIDQDQHGHAGKVERTEGAMESCLSAYERAIDALASADIDAAREALEEARSLEAEYGDDQHARDALALLAG